MVANSCRERSSTADPIRNTSRILALLFVVAVALEAGCSNSPGRVETPEWDPASFSAKAVADLDANGDARLNGDELAKAPGLAAGAKLIDQDGDGALSGEELTRRFELYAQHKVGLSARQLRLMYRGRPLAGADVKLLPETFLEGVIEPASGQTDPEGFVAPDAGVDGLPGMRGGYYRVQVTSSRVPLPAKFNTETALGVEVSNLREDAASYGPIEVRLID